MSIAVEWSASGGIAPLQTVVCPICDSDRVHYAFSIGQVRVLQCADCKFTARTQANATLADGSGAAAATRLAATAGPLCALIRPLLGPAERPARLRVVDWQTRSGVSLVDGSAPIGTDPDSAATVAISVGQLEAFIDPMPSLRDLRRQLAENQPVVFLHSNIHQNGMAVRSSQWEKLAAQQNAYIDTPTALTVLFRAGYRCLGVQRLRSHATANSAETAILAIPRSSDIPLVSIVVPVYNEATTVAEVLDAILRVRLTGAAVEIVIVESNSTDGSREIVRRYAEHPRVKCVFEERPRGKGHATRLGLANAQGDVLLIQDADLEYDIEDYPSLLNPIIRGHEAFVLGSRHGGRQHWKLRQFNKPFLATFYNLAHVFVTGYINFLFRLNLCDPQTMFKVCRRDCIEGLEFHGNYFNFDYELLLKIVRKGYKPVEVPVNYRSRSHAEGKKIRMWRDAPLGLWMITKLRLTPLRHFLNIGEPVE